MVSMFNQDENERVGTVVYDACNRVTRILLLFLAILTGAVSASEVAVKVDVSGIDGEILKNVRSFLSITGLEPKKRLVPLPLPGGKMPLVTADEVRRLHQRAEQEIREALQPFGYYEPNISSSLKREDDRWIARYEIVPGPAVVVGTVDIRIQGPGQDEAALKTALEAIAISSGQRLEHSGYETAKKSLLDTALASGYLDARYTQSELRVSVVNKRADISLVLETGKQYFYGDINIEQDILAPEFVARYVKLESGTPFDARKLLDLHIALSDSGYFRRVEVRIDREQAENYRIPVTVETEPAKPRRYGAGVGFSTDTGPRLSLAAEFRRINRRGHSIMTELRASQVKNEIGLQYRIPIKNVATDQLVFSGKGQSEEVGDDGNSDSITLGISQNTEWKSYHRRLYINFLQENFDIGEDDKRVTYLIPGASLSRLKSDSLFYPRRGFSWTVDLRGSPGQLLSDTSFLRGEAVARAVWPLGERSRLLLRGTAGGTSAGDFSVLPTGERFFAGGDQSVRGYDYQTLGPVDDTGEVVGGRHLLAGSIEIDRLIHDNFGAAVFVDSGNAFNDSTPDLKTGVGAGFRWRSPIGMLRIDLAHPLDDSDDNLRLHISIGPDL